MSYGSYGLPDSADGAQTEVVLKSWSKLNGDPATLPDLQLSDVKDFLWVSATPPRSSLMRTAIPHVNRLAGGRGSHQTT